MSHRTYTCAVLLAALACLPNPGLAQTERPAESGAERRLGHSMLVGAGPSWAEGRGESSIGPALMIEADLALGRNVRLGALGDVTFVNDRFGPRTRLFAGPELKILPWATGRVRPYLTGSAVISWIDDTGFGLGGGLGAFIVPDKALPFFVDVRKYHIEDMESSPYDQIALRAGVVF